MGARGKFRNDLATLVRRGPRDRGMTLVELLVAVAIVSMLMAIAIPLVRYSLESDKLREASRQLNMMVAGARTRAIEKGRFYGIWIQRSEVNPNAAFEVFFCESPPAYIGDVMESRVAISDTDATIIGTDTAYFDLSCVSVQNQVRVGDVIRFHRTSHYFVITDADLTPTASNSGYVKFIPAFTETPLPTATSALTNPFVVPFEVIGQPRKLNVAPLQLADGVAIDLRHSGVGAEGTQFANSATAVDHVVLAFDASGSLNFLRYEADAVDVDGPVHLLVGRLDQMDDADSTPTSPNPISYDSTGGTTVSYDKNLADQASLWVTVGSRNGTVTTTENAWELRPAAGWSGTPGPPFFTNSLRRAREYAQAADAIGGA